VISFIIPTLNEEKLLPQLLSQIFVLDSEASKFEVIISDGGSTDETLQAAIQFPVRIASPESDERQTIAMGRNIGAKLAKGDIVVFINADVRFDDLELFLRITRETFADSSVAGATCSVQVFPEEERLSDRAFHMTHNAYVRFLNLIGEGMGRGECQIMRRELFEKLEGYTDAMVAGEDYDLFRRVRKQGKIAMLPGIIMFESPRRFRKYGYSKIIWGWIKNGISVIIRNESSSDVWEPVR
jgi:glycosyltransferase involved in cell wall biosynthesis